MALSLGAVPTDVLAHPLLRYVRTASVPRLLQTVESLPGFPFRRVLRIDLSGGSSLYSSLYGEAHSSLNEYLSRWWKNRFTLMKLGRNYSRNLLTNLGLAKRALPLAIPAGKVPFLAAAGPSMERAIHFVRRHRTRLFLVAVDTAARHLSDSGIAPDAIVVVESQYWIDGAFQGLAGSGIPVLADLTSRTASILRTGGPVSFFLSEYAKTALIRRLESCGTQPMIVPPLGSVGLTALYVLDELRDPGTPLFFAGLDFSWNRGFTHLRGAPAPLAEFSRSTRLTALAASGAPGIGSVSTAQTALGSVTSDPLLADYAAQSKALAGRIAERGRGPCLNAGSAGIGNGFPPADASELERAIDGAILSVTLPTRNVQGLRDGIAGADMGIFLESERESLDRLDGLILAKSGGDDSVDGELNAAMAGLDYLWLHFPDAARGCSLDADFLARARAGIGYFKKSIDRALSFLSS